MDNNDKLYRFMYTSWMILLTMLFIIALVFARNEYNRGHKDGFYDGQDQQLDTMIKRCIKPIIAKKV